MSFIPLRKVCIRDAHHIEVTSVEKQREKLWVC
jgi:hypothetical protein